MLKKVVWDFNGAIQDDAFEFYKICRRLVVTLGGQDFSFDQFRQDFSSEYIEF